MWLLIHVISLSVEEAPWQLNTVTIYTNSWKTNTVSIREHSSDRDQYSCTLSGTRQTYRQISNIRHTNPQTYMLLIPSCSCLSSIHWSQVLSREWRCSWSSADRRCSNYIWVINNFIACYDVSHFRALMVLQSSIFKIFTCFRTNLRCYLFPNKWSFSHHFSQILIRTRCPEKFAAEARFEILKAIW